MSLVFSSKSDNILELNTRHLNPKFINFKRTDFHNLMSHVLQISSVQTHDANQEDLLRVIGMDGERNSKESVLSAWLDDESNILDCYLTYRTKVYKGDNSFQ